MADKYNLCPCGSGKKVKFCCNEVAPDIEKAMNLLEGEQRAAALQHLNRVIEKHGPKPALMDLKITALLEMRELQEAEEVVLNLLQANPDAPRPHALAAIMDVMKGNIEDAVKQLQRALARLSGEDSPAQVYDALSMVSAALYEVGDPFVTRAHLLQLVNWSNPESGSRPLQMLLELDADIHPLLLIDLDDYEPPADAPWRDAYAQAQALADRGAWLAAAVKLRELAREAPDAPRLMQEAALNLGKAGSREEMILALRDFARMEAADFQDAVEAEAIAQFLDIDTGATEVISLKFPIDDAESATEKLLSVESFFSVDTERVPRDPGSPPPKGVFLALSKPLVRDEEPTHETTPLTLGQVNVFGRETDREPRLELSGAEGEDLDAIKQLVEQSLDIKLGDGDDRQVIGGRNRLNAIIAPQQFFPPGVTPAQQFAIQSDMLRERVMNVWPTTPSPHLGNKSPLEASKDSDLRIPVAASLVLLEQSLFHSQRRLDTAALREQLNLPPIDLPEEIDLEKIHRLDYSHLDVTKLDDETLMKVVRGGMVRARRLLAIEGVEEAIRRELHEKDDELSLDALFDLLARWHSSPSEQLKIVERAKEHAEAGSESMGSWLLRELVIRIESGEGPEAKQLVDLLTGQYSQIESVMQGLMHVLSRYGLLAAPGGGMGAPAPMAPSTSADVAVEMAREQQSQSGGLWTPDSGPADDGGDDKPSGLWLPD